MYSFGSFQNNLYYIIIIFLVMHSCVHQFNVAAGEGGANLINSYTAG